MKLFRQLAACALISAVSVTFSGAQSLGDVARQERSRKGSTPSGKRNVVTNDDLASRTEQGTTPVEVSEEKNAKPAGSKSVLADSKNASATEYRLKIKEQKRAVRDLETHIKDLQREMDRWKTSDCSYVRYSDNPYRNACDIPQKLTAEFGRSKVQLEKAREALEALQENARRSGFGNSVYDPD